MEGDQPLGVCDIPVVSLICDTVGEAAATLVTAPFEWLATVMGEAAAFMFEGVWMIFDTTTLVDLTSPGYMSVYNILFGVAVFVMLIFFCLQLLSGLIHRDPSALSKAALGLAKSVIGSFLVIGLTAALLEVTDQISVGIVQATGNTMEVMGERLAAVILALGMVAVPAPGASVIVTIFLAGLAISAAALVWFTLLIRKTLLLVTVVMGPIALSGFSWQATRGWFAKWASFVIALIVSKLVIVVVFLVATAQMAAPIDLDLASVGDPIAGIVLMFVAAFAPYMAYKFISFAGIDMAQAISAEQDTKNALNRPIPVTLPPKASNLTGILGADTTPPTGPPQPINPTVPPTPPPASGVGAGAGATAAAVGVAAAAVTAGPKLANQVARAAEGQANAGQADAYSPRHERTATPSPQRSSAMADLEKDG